MASALRTQPTKTPRQPRIDERFLDCTLEVNPHMRGGRTTTEVKQALLDEVRARTSGAAPVGNIDLSIIVDGFLQTQWQGYQQVADDIARRQAELEAELAAQKTALHQKVQTFLRMLDAGTLKTLGAQSIAKHRELLAELKVSATQLFDQAFGK